MSIKEESGEMPDDDEKNQGSNEEDKGSRMDAAKAFFRAMYAGEEPPQDKPAASPGDSRRLAELEAQLKEAEQRASEAESLYKRMAADFENFRRRMDRERDEFTNFGVVKALEALLPALDDLDRALLYLSAETPADKLIESFQLVASRINQCLEQAGLKRLQTKGGVVFDPRFHEPVQQTETEDFPDQTIMNELRGGYAIGEKVIRPALVIVASNPKMQITPLPELEKPAASASSSASSGTATGTATATEKETRAETASKQEESPEGESGTAENTSSSAAPNEDSRVYDLGDL